MAWPAYYTYNFCSNPSFEQDLTGVSPLGGAQVYLDTTMYLYGSNSLAVSTPGMASGEGVTLPPGTLLASATGAVSFYLQGNSPTESGTLTVFVLDTTTSTTLGTTTVTFTPQQSWQRVVLTGLAFSNTDTISVRVETAFPQITAFNIDGVQYEPTTSVNSGTLPTPYIDGDQPFGFWVSTPEESGSYKLYRYQIGASGDITTFGSGSWLVQHAVGSFVFSDPASGPTTIYGGIDLSGVNHPGLDGNVIIAPGGSVSQTGFTTLLMLAGMNDFGLWQAGDVDPAESLISWNNAGIASGTNTSGSAGYTRPFATFSAPQAFQGSLAYNVWNTAAFYALGYELATVGAGAAQNITHVQAELVPYNGNAPVPSTYQRARALTATLAPTEMNYVTTPSFYINATTGWTGINSTTITADNTHYAPVNTSIGTARTPSSMSCANTASTPRIGAWIVVPDLIVGEVYTLSAYVYPQTAAFWDIQAVVAPAGNSGATYQVFGSSITGTPPASSVALTATTWYQPFVEFTAQESTVVIAVWGIPVTGASGTIRFNTDCIMVSPGGNTTYGDGWSSGWSWESTAGTTRSYYYERGNIAYASVQEVLAGHLPLGLHAYDPVYYQPVSQYT